MLTPAIILNSSPATWNEVPLPAEAMLILPGVLPSSDIKALHSHTPVKATTDGKEQLATVAHPAAAARVEDMRDQGDSGTPVEQALLDRGDAGTAGVLNFTEATTTVEGDSHVPCGPERGRTE